MLLLVYFHPGDLGLYDWLMLLVGWIGVPLLIGVCIYAFIRMATSKKGPGPFLVDKR